MPKGLPEILITIMITLSPPTQTLAQRIGEGMGFARLEPDHTNVEKVEGRFILTEKDCQTVSQTTRGLETWTSSLSQSSQCRTEPKVNANGTCSQDVSTCLPQHVVEYFGVSAQAAGPNCWNLALVMSRILPHLRYSTPEEVAFYTRPPLCAPVPNSQLRLPGDIGLVRIPLSESDRRAGLTEADAESHAFVYVSPTLVYSKPNRTAPYRLQSLRSDLEREQVPDDPECRESAQPPTRCFRAVSYVRCTSMDQYLRTRNGSNPELTGIMGNLNSFEQCLQETVFRGSPLSSTARGNIADSTAALARYLADHRSLAQSGTEDQRFLIGALQLRIRAIERQLNSLVEDGNQDVTGLRDDLRSFSESMRRSAAEARR